MKHYLNGTLITPRNWEDLGFLSNWSDSINMNDKDSADLRLNTETIILPNEGKKIVNDWMDLNGPFKGIPYIIELSNNLKLDYYVDLTESPIFKEREVEVKIVKNKYIDNFYQLAQGSSFDYLVYANKVSFNYTNIPYIIIPQNRVELGLTLSVTTFVLVKATEDAILKTLELGVELINAFVPAVGLGAVIVIGNIISATVRLILQVAYMILLIIMIKKMVDQMSELIFPKIRYFKGCTAKELLTKTCESFGFKFKSTLLDSNSGLTLLPVPLVKSKYKGKQLKKFVKDYISNDLNFAFTKGHPSVNDSVGNAWQLIESLETMFNAKCRVTNGLVELERRDYWSTTSTESLTSSLVLQDSRQDKYSLNLNDVWKRYYIHYQPDYTDFNTLDDFDNTDVEYSTEPNDTSGIITIKGLHERNIPFALGVRKTSLDWIEKRVKDLFKVVDNLCNTSYQSIIDNRIGVLIVSQQYFGTTKLLYCSNQGKQIENFTDYISPQSLWNKYHYINQIQLNGYKIKDSVKILMNDEKFVNLLNNNWANIDGKKCEILQLDYKPSKSHALISYKEPFDYSSKHVNTIVING